MAIIGGIEAMPTELLYSLPEKKWRQPFNDRYINVSRYDLPDASLRDMAARIALQGEEVILAKGGRKILEGGVEDYQINTTAQYEAPLELPTAPLLFAEVDQPFEFTFYPGERRDKTSFSLSAGSLPPGIRLAKNQLTGIPTEVGSYTFTLQIVKMGQANIQAYQINVRSKNLAPTANTVVCNSVESAENTGNIELIRDGKRKLRNGMEYGLTFYSETPTDTPKIDYYGYTWEQAQIISVLQFNPGNSKEHSGWFSSLEVQYRDQEGQWRSVKDLVITPAINFDNDKYLKGKDIDHTLSFSPVTTTGIRIIGAAGGVDPNNPTETRRYYSSISELSVHRQ